MSQVQKNTLARSTRLFQTGIQASGRFTQAPNMEQVRADMQNMYRQRMDSRYNDRALPLPPVQKRQRLNLNAGRIDLTEKLKDRNHGGYFEDDQRYGIISINTFLHTDSFLMPLYQRTFENIVTKVEIAHNDLFLL